jgi:chaperonin GroES
MNLRPLHDRVIVKRFEEAEQTIGGIIVPDSAREKPQRGRIVAAGAGRVRKDGGRVALAVKAGDVILFGKYSGQEIKVAGEELLIMKEEDVLLVFGAAGGERAAPIAASKGRSAGRKARAAQKSRTARPAKAAPSSQPSRPKGKTTTRKR